MKPTFENLQGTSGKESFPEIKKQIIDYFTNRASDEERKEFMKRLEIEVEGDKKPEEYIEEVTEKVNGLTDYDKALDIFTDITSEEAKQEQE